MEEKITSSWLEKDKKKKYIKKVNERNNKNKLMMMMINCIEFN